MVKTMMFRSCVAGLLVSMAGALYAARSPYPLSAGDMAIVENLVKTGTPSASGDFLVTGWGKSGAVLQVTTRSFVVDGNAVPVFHLDATVPFDPIVPSLVDWLGLSRFTISLSHEQAYLGT